MTQKTYRGDTIGRIFHFKDENDAYFDPSTVTIKIIDPNGTTKATLSLSDLTKIDTGQYKMTYNVPNDAEYGLWTIQVTATASGNAQNTEEFVFDVVRKKGE